MLKLPYASASSTPPIDWMKSKTGCGVGNALDDIGEWIGRAHQLSPAMAGDVDGIVNVDAVVQAILDHTDIDVRGIEQRLAVRPPIAQRSEVAVRRTLCYCARERKPVGMYAGAREQDDGIAVLDVRANQPAFRLDHADRGAGQDDRGGLDNPAQRRCLSAAPRAAGKLARLPPTLDKIRRCGVRP